MPMGGGRYEDLCAYVREQAVADSAIVIVLGGTRGSGFDVQGEPRTLLDLPNILRTVASELDKSGAHIRDAAQILDS